MKNNIVIWCILCIQSLQAQINQGVITYERQEMWVNIMSKMPFMSKEDIEKEMAIWGKQQGDWKEKYLLEFNTNSSMYKEKPKDENFGYSWRGDEIFCYRDLVNKTLVDKAVLGDKDVVIKDNIPLLKWKILNELRDIQGYICMKAQTKHPIYGSPVTAWYTDKIPISSGPEGFGGLPGMILMLELNVDDVIIEATNINTDPLTNPIALPKKIKGKTSNSADYANSKNKFIKQSIDGRRNPYWNTRY
jgi:GLPGLI family protein